MGLVYYIIPYLYYFSSIYEVRPRSSIKTSFNKRSETYLLII